MNGLNGFTNVTLDDKQHKGWKREKKEGERDRE